MGRVALAGDAKAAPSPLERALKIAGARPVDEADVRFALAQAVWSNGDHERAVALARQALDRYTRTAPYRRTSIGDVNEWLAHRR
jgi:hypothetical protein